MKKTWLIVLTALIGLFPSCACIVKLSSWAPDFEPPTFTVLTPAYQGTQPVPYPVSFQVQIQDPSGVYYKLADPIWSIILRQRNSALNYAYNPSSGILTYTDAAGTKFQKGQCYAVTIEAHDMLKNVGSLTLYFTVADPDNPDPQTGYYPCPNPSIVSPAVCLRDSDYDGIPNDGITLSDGNQANANQQRTYGSEDYGIALVKTTSPSLRTLYIRPLLKQSDGSVVLWEDFENRHLPEVSIPFKRLGIELRPIMSLTYNPYTDMAYPYKPPISIVEITYDLNKSGDSTYFSTMSKQWNWGLLGVTPYETGDCTNKDKHGYFRATIYGNSIKTYSSDRQYSDLQASVGPSSLTGPFTGAPGYSPMNFGNDGTVEFNKFVFTAAGAIATPVPQAGAARLYTEDQVIQRLIAHEIGHTLLNASEGDHCSNPSCIMYGALSSVAGWGISGNDTSGNVIGFGPGSGKTACTHSQAKTYDLRPRVYNALNPKLLPPNYNCPLP